MPAVKEEDTQAPAQEAPPEEIKVYIQNGPIFWPFFKKLFEDKMEEGVFIDEITLHNAVHMAIGYRKICTTS